MKKALTILSLFLACVIYSNHLQAQTKYFIKNVWQNTYLLNDFKNQKITCEGESAKEGAAAVWILEFVGGTTHVFRLKNDANGGYLYLKNGKPVCGTIGKKEKAAMWIFQQVDDNSGQIRLRNVLNNTLYLNNEKNPKLVECSVVQPGFLSAKWKIEEVE